MRPRFRFLAGAVFVVLALVASPVSAACPATTLGQQFGAADVVATATVYSVFQVDDGSTEVYLDPLTIYKGTDLVNDSLIVVVPAGQADPVAFAEGDESYLVLLKIRDEETFSTDTCAGSRLLGAGLTPDEQAALGEGTPIAELFPELGLDGDQPEGAVDPATLFSDLGELTVDEPSVVARAADWVDQHLVVVLLLTFWSFVAHGYALWHAGRSNRLAWFIILVVPTVGLVPVVYLLVVRFTRRGPPAASVPPL